MCYYTFGIVFDFLYILKRRLFRVRSKITDEDDRNVIFHAELFLASKKFGSFQLIQSSIFLTPFNGYCRYLL